MTSLFAISLDGKTYDYSITRSEGLQLTRKTGFLKREVVITPANPIVKVEVSRARHEKGSNTARGIGMAVGALGGLPGMALGAAIADRVSKGTDKVQLSVTTKDARCFIFTVLAKQYEQIVAHAQLSQNPSPPSNTQASGGDPQARLQKLKDLCEKGLLTQAEYELKRKALVDAL